MSNEGELAASSDGPGLEAYVGAFRAIGRETSDAAVAAFMRSTFARRAHGYLLTHFPELHENDVVTILTDLVLRLTEVAESRLARVNGDGVGLVLAMVDGIARDHRRGYHCRRRAERAYAAIHTAQVTDAEEGVDGAVTAAEFEDNLRTLLKAVLHGLQLEIILADLNAGGQADGAELAARLNTTRGTIYAERHEARQRLSRHPRMRKLLYQIGR